MAIPIREIVARRSDLSTFLVHLTRNHGAAQAKANLEAIIRAGAIEARNGFGSAMGAIGGTAQSADSQKVVCFTETPLEHISLLVQEIESREYNFTPYGIALPKLLGRKRGINPVWYLDITPGHGWLTTPLNALIAAAIATGDYGAQPVAKLTPFIEQMGTQPGGYKKEFWWEREWRHQGDFTLPHRYLILAPEADHGGLTALATANGKSTKAIDPQWSLEEIIASLAGFPPDEIGSL